VRITKSHVIHARDHTKHLVRSFSANFLGEDVLQELVRTQPLLLGVS
jgi:hypothetical protein